MNGFCDAGRCGRAPISRDPFLLLVIIIIFIIPFSFPLPFIWRVQFFVMPIYVCYNSKHTLQFTKFARFLFLSVLVLGIGVVEGKIFGGDLWDVEVDDPVHEVETGETNGKDDARVLVDGGRRSAVHDVEVLALADQRQVVRVRNGRHLHHRAARFVRALSKRKDET